PGRDRAGTVERAGAGRRPAPPRRLPECHRAPHPGGGRAARRSRAPGRPVTASTLATVLGVATLVAASDAMADPAPAAMAPAPRGVVERDVLEVSPPVGAGVPRVSIENRYGDVTIVGH